MSNLLFPVFFRLDRFTILMVGAGAVGTEKMGAILAQNPHAAVKLVAPEIHPDLSALISTAPNVQYIAKSFESSDLEGCKLVVSATANREINEQVAMEARAKGILCNIADTPELCDFYLGSIVKKGELKIAISTNGKSPTMAKRIREMLEGILPEDLDILLHKLTEIRASLKHDFETKVRILNELTSDLIKPKSHERD